MTCAISRVAYLMELAQHVCDVVGRFFGGRVREGGYRSGTAVWFEGEPDKEK